MRVVVLPAEVVTYLAGRTSHRFASAQAGSADGGRLIYASSVVMLDSARRKVPTLARCLLGLSIAAMLTADTAHGQVPPC